MSAGVIDGVATVVARSVAELLGAGEVPEVPSVVVVGQGPSRASGWLVVQEAVARERRCAVVGLGGGVLAAGLITEVMVASSPAAAADPLPAWVMPLAGALWEAQRVQSELARFQAATAAHFEAACEFADAKGYCSDFDEFMEDRGLPGRNRPYTVTIRASVDVEVQVRARSVSMAEDSVGDSEIADALSEMGSHEILCAVGSHEVLRTETVD